MYVINYDVNGNMYHINKNNELEYFDEDDENYDFEDEDYEDEDFEEEE